MRNSIGNQKGQILGIVLAFVFLMALLIILLINVIKQDAYLIQKVKFREQAQYVAEAGIYHALARMKEEGFDARTDFNGSMDTGTYSVSFAVVRGRYLITSTGSVRGISVNVSVEVENVMPDAVRYAMSAGDDVQVYSFVSDAKIDGDLRANDDVNLLSGFWSAALNVSTTGISAVGIVRLGYWYDVVDLFDIHVVINGVASEEARTLAVVDEDAFPMALPVFDYRKYREDAIASGDYYDKGQVFTSTTLSPGNGIVFVDGNAVFEGNCTLDGGIVANGIRVNGTLVQRKSGDKNVIIARTWDVEVRGRLYAEEALIYAEDDIESIGDHADFEVNGVMVCRGDISITGSGTRIDIDYSETYPAGLESEDEEGVFHIVSWNY
ncbi:MAG: hypothetical protein WBD17_02660 [Candidatus Omnitrophota bacterium]